MLLLISANYVICNKQSLFDTIVETKNPIKNKNYYDQYFASNSHWVWLYNINENYCIICVLKNSECKIIRKEIKYIHTALIIDKDGQKLFNISVNKSCKNTIEKIFKQKYSLYNIKNKLFNKLIPTIETLYSNYVKNMSIGVVNIKTTQNTRKEWFSNQITNNFLNFINLLGIKINSDEWYGYKGNLSNGQEAIYSHWKGVIPIIYHITPFLDEDEQRKLIGNDLLIIIYVEIDETNEGNTELNLTNLDQLGQMPQCFAIVCKTGTKYKLHFITKNNIPDKGPYSFSQSLPFENIKETILTEFYNIMNYLHKHDTFKKMYMIPRQIYINSLIETLNIKHIKTLENDHFVNNKNNSFLHKTNSDNKLSGIFDETCILHKNKL